VPVVAPLPGPTSKEPTVPSPAASLRRRRSLLAAALALATAGSVAAVARAGSYDVLSGAGIFHVVDTTAPTSGAVIGGLVSGDAHGTAYISFDAVDADAGIFRALLQVDGAQRVEKRFSGDLSSCRDVGAGGLQRRFEKAPPCPTYMRIMFGWNTNEVSNGVHATRLLVEDAAGNQTVAYDGKIIIRNAPLPYTTSPPRVVGVAQLGQTLSADQGTWSSDPGVPLHFSGQWQRGTGPVWQDVPGATGMTYVVTAADSGMRLRYLVQATNGDDGSVRVASSPTALVEQGVPTNRAPSGPGSSSGGSTSMDHAAPAAQPTVPAPSPNGRSAGANAVLTALVQGSTRPSVRLRWGARRDILGRLETPGGDPIAGASLEVTSTAWTPGARSQLLGDVETDAHGRFRLTIPNGVSRTLRFAYRTTSDPGAPAQSVSVAVQVVPKITLRANHRALRNGAAVRFTGRLAGAFAGGRKIVEMQALNGRSWQTFGTTRLSERGGAFAYRYHFQRTYYPTTYKFRAVVKADYAWPFETGVSSVVTVKVRP